MSYETQICELYFSLHKDNYQVVGSKLEHLLICLISNITSNNNPNKKNRNIENLRILYALIGHTRDIYCGHGLRDVSYMMIYVWYQYFPVLAINAFQRFIQQNSFDDKEDKREDKKDTNEIYGCWNDVKYFCKFISKISPLKMEDPLIDVAVSFANTQLLVDYFTLRKINNIHNQYTPSNLSKWIPRENKINWLFKKLVIDWFTSSKSSIEPNQNQNINQNMKYYRQMISENCRIMSKTNNTDTNHSQWKKVIKDEVRDDIIKEDEVRDIIKDEDNGRQRYFFENVFIGLYIKAAIAIIERWGMGMDKDKDMDENKDAIWLNQKWSRLQTSFAKFQPSIPIVDISADIPIEDVYTAIGFACLIALKSGTNRIMIASTTPVWIDVSDDMSICGMVKKILEHLRYRTKSHMSHCLQYMTDGLYNTSNKKPQFFIFSNDLTYTCNQMNDIINGLSKSAQLVLWNVSSININMDEEKEEDSSSIIKMSGSSAALLSYVFFNDKTNKTNDKTYTFISDILTSMRYKSLCDYFDRVHAATGF